MKANEKGKQVRSYIGEEEEGILKKLVQVTESTDTFVISQILRAGLRACRDSGNRLTLPLRFTVTDTPTVDPSRIPESPAKSRK